MKWSTHGIAALTLGLALAVPAEAQVSVMVDPGDEVRVRKSRGLPWVEGIIVDGNDEWVTIEVDDGTSERVADINDVSLEGGRWTVRVSALSDLEVVTGHIGRGSESSLVGAGVFGIAGLLVGSSRDDDSPGRISIIAVGAGALGALVGRLVGNQFKRVRWESIPLEPDVDFGPTPDGRLEFGVRLRWTGRTP